MNKILSLLAVVIFFGACNEKNMPAQNQTEKEVSQFFGSFAPIQKPFELLTDANNISIFNALMSEHFLIDSNLSAKYAFNADHHADSLQKAASTEHFQYYNLGKVCQTPNYYLVLYGRNSLQQEDAHVFLASFDKQGNKIDEIIFHKPLMELPPIEISESSKITSDSTFEIKTVTEEHAFVDKKGKYMELVRQIAHQKNYKVDITGKIELVDSQIQEIWAKELAQKQNPENTKAQAKTDTKAKSFKVKPL